MPQQLESIVQEAVLGCDCDLLLNGKPVQGWTNFCTEFIAGQKPRLTFWVRAGMNLTFYGLWKNHLQNGFIKPDKWEEMIGRAVQDFSMTDFPSFEEMTQHYGEARIVGISRIQEASPSLIAITIEWEKVVKG